MSKVSLHLIVALLSLAMKGVNAAIRAVQVIRDLLDDGKLNGSADLPAWINDVQNALDIASTTISEMNDAYSVSESAMDNANGHA